MKKQFILVGAIAVLGLGVFLASCSKDEEKVGGNGDKNSICRCTIKYQGESDYEDFDLSEFQGLFKNCTEFQNWIKQLDEFPSGASVSCKVKK